MAEKPTITKNKITQVQTLDPVEVKKNILKNFVTQEQSEFELRNQNQQDIRMLEKTATSKSASNSNLVAQQNREIEERLSVSENAGTRVGRRRSIEDDISCIQKKQQLELLKARATTKPDKLSIDQQIIKLQRKCNHNFNKTTGECDLCGKPRSAHI